jgi:hypothetical protein
MNFNRHISDLFGMSLVLEKKTLTPQLFKKKVIFILVGSAPFSHP